MRLHLTVLAALMAVPLAACSTSSSSTATQSVPSSQPAAATSSSSAPASSPPSPVAAGSTTASGALSGTWNGQYSGSFAGTFTLNWQQTGSQLSGLIHLSYPDTAEHISGTFAGGNIRFGTVGSGAAITYSGTVAGNSMSGIYQVDDSGGDHGQWSASKSS